MRFKANILANYASQIYISLIGVVMLPIYLRLMGAEAFGLIGFFAILQVWFGLLDLGMSTTVSRETARHIAGAIDAVTFKKLIRTLEVLFLILSTVGALILLFLSGYISTHWLKVNQLNADVVERCIQIMSLIVALRWMSGLHRSIIQGAEKFVWLAWYSSLTATARFVLVVPMMLASNVSPLNFFGFQLIVAILEFCGLWICAYRFLPILPRYQRVSFEISAIKPILKFSLTIAFAAIVWIVLTQTDKLILSRILTLEDYGYFSLAVMLASSILMISGPISMTIMPRMVALEAEGLHKELIELYRRATQWVAIIASTASVTIAFFAHSILLIWTGNVELSNNASATLVLYTVGNSILAMSAFPYYLQYAKGDLQLHLIGSIVFVVLLVPITIYAATTFGAIGAGYAWVSLNLLSLFAWAPLVHSKLAKGLNRIWFVQDILMIYIPVIFCGFLLQAMVTVQGSRIHQFLMVFAIGIGLFIIALSGASEARRILISMVKNSRGR